LGWGKEKERPAGKEGLGWVFPWAGLWREGAAGAAWKWVGPAGLRVGFGFLLFSFPFLFQTHSNYLFEFKSNLNSNSYALKQLRNMHQHECTHILALK
jgi:hypothetical protein